MGEKHRTPNDRQNANLSISCGQVEKNTVNKIAKDRGYNSTADFLRDAVNAFIGKEVLFRRPHPNQHTIGRGNDD